MLRLYSVNSNRICDIICLQAFSCIVTCQYSGHLELINYICCNEISVHFKAIKNNLHLIIYMKTAVFSGITHWIIKCHEANNKAEVYWLMCGYIVAFPEDSTSHEIGFAVAVSSKA